MIFEDNSKIISFFIFSIQTYVLTPSLVPSQRDSSEERSQNRFVWRNKNSYPKIIIKKKKKKKIIKIK